MLFNVTTESLPQLSLELSSFEGLNGFENKDRKVQVISEVLHWDEPCQVGK